MQIGDIVQVDTMSEKYKVAGINDLGWIWISIIETEYDGYNGDAILRPEGEKWVVVQSDNRSNFQTLVSIKQIGINNG